MQVRTGRFRHQIILLLLGISLCAVSFSINHWRYQTFRVSGPLDLAYFNQQHWNLWHGIEPLTIRPKIIGASEGPEPWRTGRLRPITMLVFLIYRIWPGVPILMLVQSVAIGCGVWPAYALARRYGEDPRCGLWGAACYAGSPVILLLSTNDFRYFYFGIPCCLALLNALEQRRPRSIIFWTLALLSIRSQLTSVLVALGFSQLFRSRPVMENLKWFLWTILCSIVWGISTLAYLGSLFGLGAVDGYLKSMADPVNYYGRNAGQQFEALSREGGRLVTTAGPHLLTGLAAPELLVPALTLGFPPLKMGLFTLDPHQQYVRFLTPAGAMLVAATLVSIGRLWRFGRIGRWAVAALLGVCLLGWGNMVYTLMRMPSRLPEDDIVAMRRALEKIGPNDSVLADRSVLPNLSSRHAVYDYSQPPGERSIADIIGEVDWVVVSRQQREFVSLLEADSRFRLDTPLDRLLVFRSRSR